jgi:excisionase family DNA binding protein
MEADQDILSQAVLIVAEVAAILRIVPKTVHRLFDRGELPGFKVGTDRKIYASSVADFQRRHANVDTNAEHTTKEKVVRAAKRRSKERLTPTEGGGRLAFL